MFDVLKREWTLKVQNDEDVSNLRASLGVSDVTARLLINRGITNDALAKEFLNKSEDSLFDPMLLPDMDKAVRRIKDALERGEKITVFGDYDVDGVTSTAILHRYLSSKGAEVAYHIPKRDEDGYGVSMAAVSAISEDGTKLIITVDSGITAIEEIAYANEIGLDVVVTDHHECRPELPPACAVVNPKRGDSLYPFKELAGVGVVFKLICAMEGRDRLLECIDKYAELAAFGTIADVMPLIGENRIIVSIGMKKIESAPCKGLYALIQNSGVGQKKLTAGTVGYLLAPRVNAVGRLGCADVAVELFLTEDEEEADRLAKELCDSNRARQDEENKILTEAEAMIAADEDFDTRRVIVLAKEGWISGIIGIVASRLADKYHLPTVMVSFDQDGLGKGSCRSIRTFNIYEALETCSGHLEKFGGHALAAGLSVRKENLEGFRAAINDVAESTITEDDLIPRLSVDCEIKPCDITLDTVADISFLEPYGMGNPSPVFMCKELTVADVTPLSGDKHLKLFLKNGDTKVTAFMFGRNLASFPFTAGRKVDICATLDVNTFRGVSSVQVVIKDTRQASSEALYLSNGMARHEAFKAGDALWGEDIPTKADFVEIYKLLQGGEVKNAEEIAIKLTTTSGGIANICKISLCLDVLEEMGIIDRTKGLVINKIVGKVNLNESRVLMAAKAKI